MSHLNLRRGSAHLRKVACLANVHMGVKIGFVEYIWGGNVSKVIHAPQEGFVRPIFGSGAQTGTKHGPKRCQTDNGRCKVGFNGAAPGFHACSRMVNLARGSPDVV